MNAFKEAFTLLKTRHLYKSKTLQHRLLLFFVLVVVCVMLSFTMLLMLFGITGSGKQSVQQYMESELTRISATVENDFGNLSVLGIGLADSLAEITDEYFAENGISAEDLLASRERINALLNLQMPELLSIAEQSNCGGAFIIFDDIGEGDTASGVFIKKTQPIPSASLASEVYFLRGPAATAREFKVELLGQWQMYYDSDEIAFIDKVIENAENHPDLPSSRLYYWTPRICLNGNSEAGVLLCVPLISDSGSVYGICGLEVSDRMFKQLYSPNEQPYGEIFAIMAPTNALGVHAPNGLTAGNSFLTSIQIKDTLKVINNEKGFIRFSEGTNEYGGLTARMKLYPLGSPHENEVWTMSVLLPNDILAREIRGKSEYLFAIVGGLLLASLVACFFVSRRYLRPIQQGLASIQNKDFSADDIGFGVLEIDSLFEELSRDIRQYNDEIAQLTLEKERAQEQFEKAQARLGHLSDSRKQEIDPDDFENFQSNLDLLTEAEYRLFKLYLDGKTSKEIKALLGITDNTLKYHNRNIYGKLGVTSRKQLLTYAAVMEDFDTEEK